MNITEGTIHDNTITGNTFLNNTGSYPSAEFDGYLGSVNFGSYNLNKYFSTYFGYPVSQTVTNTTTSYSLADWRTASGQDAQSSDIGSFFSASKVAAYLGSNLITNSTFDSNANSWTTYSTDNSANINQMVSCGLDSGCLHVSMNIPLSLLISNSFSLQSGTAYEVSFSIISNAAYSGTAIVRKASTTYANYAKKNFTTSSSRQNISFTFIASTSLTNDARIDLQTNVADYYIDDISIRPVTPHNTSNDSVLETNSTSSTSTVNLGGSKYCDIDNNAVSGSFTLAPFSSKVLLSCFNNSDLMCNNHETHDSAPSDCPGTSDEGTYTGMDAPLQMGTDKPDIASNVRLYSQGKFRNILTPSGTTADLAITPPGMGGSTYSQYMDLVINTWNNTGVRHKQWTESSSTIGSASTLHTVGDLAPFNFYYVSVNSSLGSNITGSLGTVCLRGVCQANAQGKITFIYSGGYSTHTFDITQGVSNSSPTPPWTQLDWSGGSGQTNWSDITKFLSSTNVTTSTPNQITLSLSSVEKFTNTTFDTNLTGWSGTQNYTLDDEFTTNRSVGAVNGTSAEPTGGTRTVTDTNSKISISSDLLSFATAEASNDGIWYSSLARVLGKTVIFRITPGSATTFGAGFDINTTTTVNDAIRFNSGSITLQPNGASQITGVGTYTEGQTYYLALTARTTGMIYFIKGGTEYTNWTQLGNTTTGSGALIPALVAYSTTSVFTSDYIRVPSTLWIPTPLAYDTFTRANGSLGSTETAGPDSQTTPSLGWTGSTWTVSSNAALNTPTLGTEIVTNGGMETGNPPTGWTHCCGTETVTADTSIVHSGSQSIKEVTWAGQSDIRQAFTASLGTWYDLDGWIYSDGTHSATLSIFQNSSPFAQPIGASTSNASWTHLFGTGRPIGTTNYLVLGILHNSNVAGETWYMDDVSLKPLTTSQLFSSITVATADVIADTNVTLTSGTQAGLVLNLDSTSNPQNYILAYHDGSKIYLDKVVAGTYTNLISTTTTYSAGATLRVIKDGTKYRVYYNNALVGSEQTISDAGIISNTKHGLFSTYSGNSFDNFTVWPRGTGGEYNTTIPADDLTVTEDATHTRGSSSGATKIIAGGNNNNFYQNVNVGDTSTYNLIAYVYTDGSAVTSADAQLIANGTLVTTTYTVDSGGWYKLTGTATGVASSVGYGVQVKAGKTVWVDDMSLKPQSATGTLTSSIFDGGAGVSWGNLTYNVSTPTNTSVSVKVITSATSTISTSFSSCSAISSGGSISSGGCNSGEYAQYQVTLSSTDLSQTPTFTSITLNFTEPPL